MVSFAGLQSAAYLVQDTRLSEGNSIPRSRRGPTDIRICATLQYGSPEKKHFKGRRFESTGLRGIFSPSVVAMPQQDRLTHAQKRGRFEKRPPGIAGWTVVTAKCRERPWLLPRVRSPEYTLPCAWPHCVSWHSKERPQMLLSSHARAGD